MNDFSELEAELRRLRPAAVSTELMTRVECALEQSATPAAGVLPRRRTVRVNWFAVGLGLAAAAAFVALARINNERRVPQQPSVASTAATSSETRPAVLPNESTFVPDGLTRVVYHRQNEGLVFPSDSEQPVRRLRSRSHEILQWKNPQTGASLRVSYPTEEIELVPVRGQ